MNDRTSGLQKALAERADKEAADIRAILTELQRTIQDKLDDPELQQMTFEGWADDERHQLERNMNALRVRVREIPGEIKRETDGCQAAVCQSATPDVPGVCDVPGAGKDGEGMRVSLLVARYTYHE